MGFYPSPTHSGHFIFCLTSERSISDTDYNFCLIQQSILLLSLLSSGDKFTKTRTIMTDNNNTPSSSTTTKALFQKQHYDAIAELIGQKIVYGMMDERDYSIIEAFAEMFAEDDPTAFDKAAFRDAVYEAHSRKTSGSSKKR
jgi:hypothetical protein